MRNVLTKKIMFADTAATTTSGSSIVNSENTKLLALENADEAATVAEKEISKKSGKGEGNPLESFYLTSLIAAYFLFPFWAIACTIHYVFLERILTGDSLKYVMLSGLMHAAYNLSSFGFLSRVSTPTTHAIANVFKRVFTIWSAVVFFGSSETSMTSLTVGGLLVSTIGLFWYGSITASSSKKG